jgi:hypothetical protein
VPIVFVPFDAEGRPDEAGLRRFAHFSQHLDPTDPRNDFFVGAGLAPVPEMGRACPCPRNGQGLPPSQKWAGLAPVPEMGRGKPCPYVVHLFLERSRFALFTVPTRVVLMFNQTKHVSENHQDIVSHAYTRRNHQR